MILQAVFGLVPADPARLEAEAQRILAARNARQPTGVSTAGCIFKNPGAGTSAGELIDRAGLKGKRVGDAEVSPAHANFIVNTGRARASDIIELMSVIQTTVAKRFQIDLEPEVVVVGMENHGKKSV